MFFHFVVKFNVLVDFCESCKKSGVVSKVYAFDSARMFLLLRTISKKSASGIFIRNAFSIMSSSRC